MDLVEFLTARLDDDAAAAKRVESRWRQIGETGVIVASDGTHAEECANGNWAGIAEHIVRHDPARVLAEVDAKRRILASYTEAVLVRDEATQWAMSPSPVITNPGADGVERWTRARDAAFFLEPAIRLLAQPYASHPDYDEAWCP